MPLPSSHSSNLSYSTNSIPTIKQKSSTSSTLLASSSSLSSSTLNSSLVNSTSNICPNRIRQGDSYWIRVMQTKESQWRFLNAIALHELNILERNACAELETLCKRLDACADEAAKLSLLLDQCREKRVIQLCSTLSKAPLQKLFLSKPNLLNIHQLLDQNHHSIHLSTNQKSTLIDELIKFQSAAKQFYQVSNQNGLTQLANVAKGIQNVATLITHQNTNLTNSTQKVTFAADLIQDQTSSTVTKVVQRKSVAFALKPTFVD